MKIAIAGYGVEGKANYAYWAKDPANELTIVDQRPIEQLGELPEGARVTTGEAVFLERLDDFDLVIRTAGLAPYKLQTSTPIWSGTNEFFARCGAPIIGVTGTKGKGTTASLIHALFTASGRKSWLVGNIGLAAITTLSDIQPSDIVVYELSSFQLWDIEKSPQTAVVLMIESDHLNVHTSMEEYVQAKAGIARYQGAEDYCVYHSTNVYSAEIAQQSNASSKARYGAYNGGGVYVENGVFRNQDKIICSVDALQLRGAHNVENACAALTVAIYHGLSNEVIEKGLRSFQGLPHRLEFVRSLEGVEYFNDSFSSAVGATIAAIRSFENPQIVIIGGVDKGGDFGALADEVAGTENIKEIILVGTVRQTIYKMLKERGVGHKATVFDGSTMTEIVSYAHSRAESGDVVLLSPGCASFDMFRDFYDRGDQFREEVRRL